MEFWGAEIKSGETVVVEREGGKMLHLSQACLVDKKNKDTEPVYLFAKVGDQKFVIGILSSEKIPRVSFDLVFKNSFELSHTSKYGSIHMLGYRGSEEEEDEAPDSEPVQVLDKQGTSNSETTTKAEDSSEEDDSMDGSSDDEKGMKDEEESSDDELETDDEDSDGSEEEKEVDKQKAETSKKRPAETATKTPSADKKVKLVTPEKSASNTGGNKVHVATPYPKKPTGKVAAKSENTSAFECKPCKKSFGSDIALQSHTKAKHGSGK